MLDRAVKATVAAILDNARRSQPPLPSILLKVIGPARYRRAERLYPISPRPPASFGD